MSDTSPKEQPKTPQDKTQLVQQLVQQIRQATEDQDFQLADGLREKLMTTDPTALSEIIQTASLIEEAKTAGLDKDHIAIWEGLYGNLSDEEINCLFYSLKSVVVPPKKRILAHGAYNTKLFFIDKGSVTVLHPQGDKNVVLAQLGRGELLGEFTFITISLCSATVVSTSEVHLRYLEGSVADSWLDSQPALYDKLVHFCQTHGKIDEIISRKDFEKRRHLRYKADGVATAVILTKEGKMSSSQIKGGVANISEAGCCFDIHCSKREIARALLARHCHITFELNIGGQPVTATAVGKIVRVSFHLHNDYSVHVKFIQLIDKSVVDKIAAQSEEN